MGSRVCKMFVGYKWVSATNETFSRDLLLLYLAILHSMNVCHSSWDVGTHSMSLSSTNFTPTSIAYYGLNCTQLIIWAQFKFFNCCNLLRNRWRGNKIPVVSELSPILQKLLLCPDALKLSVILSAPLTSDTLWIEAGLPKKAIYRQLKQEIDSRKASLILLVA